MNELRLTLFGPPEARIGERLVRFPTRKAFALLIYLALVETPIRRPQLLTIFWPDSDETRARGALRQTLLGLRRALGVAAEPYILAEADALSLNPGQFYTPDTTQLMAAVETARDDAALAACLELNRGPFLAGFDLPDASDFEAWVSQQRVRFGEAWQIIYGRRVLILMGERRWDQALSVARRWLAEDDLNELAYRRLMEIHLLQGNRAAAQNIFAQCRERLATELAIAPAAETEALLQSSSRLQRLALPDLERPAGRMTTSSAPFVGRSTEFALLTRQYEQAIAGVTQLMVIEGEPGIGKSRLAAEFVSWVDLQGGEILYGRAFESGGRLPYQPVIEALRPRLDRENAPEDLLADIWLTELSRLLPELQERYPDLPPPQAPDQLGHTRLLEAVARLFLAWTRLGDDPLVRPQPLLLYLDDLQWVDVASLDLLRYCRRSWAAAGAPIVLLCALRTEAVVANPALRDWLSVAEPEAAVQRIKLTNLSAAETEALVERWAAATPASFSPLRTTEISQRLYAETAGQPFYLVEAIKSWPDTGSVGSVQRLIQSRLNPLSDTARTLLDVAAVLGRPCRYERLCQIAELKAASGLYALEELLQRQFLVETREASRPYSMAHDKIREVVYDAIGLARRRHYHQVALTALAESGSPAAELGRHAEAAGAVGSALNYYVAAGDEASALFAIRDAVEQYEQARVLHQSNVVLASSQSLEHLYSQLVRAYELAGELVKAEAVAREMLDQARERGWPETVCAALNRLASLAIYTQRLDMAADLLHKAEAVASSNNLQRWQAETEWGWAQLAQHRYDMVATKRHSRQALDLARAGTFAELEANSLNNLGYAHFLLGELAEAQTVMTEARRAQAALGNLALEADCLTALGGIEIFAGRAASGVRLVEDALRKYRSIENPWGELFSSGWLAAGRLDLGLFSLALAQNERLADLVGDMGTTPVTIWNRLWVGNAQRALGDITAALNSHRKAAALNEKGPLTSFAWYIAAELCADLLWLERDEEAFRQAKAVVELRSTRAIPQIVLPYAAVVTALCRGGRADLAQAMLAQDAVVWQRTPRFMLAFWQARAVIAHWADERDAAQDLLARALSFSEELGLIGVQWAVLRQLAAWNDSGAPGERYDQLRAYLAEVNGANW